MRLRPSEIRFKQDSIKKSFQDGRDVNETAQALANGYISVNEFPQILVAKKNNKYYACDNRRLYVFRVAEYQGAISYIDVKIARANSFNNDTFTTTDDGRKVEVRGRRTLPHCKDHWLTSSEFPMYDMYEANMTYQSRQPSVYRSPQPAISRYDYTPPTPRRIVYSDHTGESWSNPKSSDSPCSCTIL